MDKEKFYHIFAGTNVWLIPTLKGELLLLVLTHLANSHYSCISSSGNPKTLMNTLHLCTLDTYVHCRLFTYVNCILMYTVHSEMEKRTSVQALLV